MERACVWCVGISTFSDTKGRIIGKPTCVEIEDLEEKCEVPAFLGPPSDSGEGEAQYFSPMGQVGHLAGTLVTGAAMNARFNAEIGTKWETWWPWSLDSIDNAGLDEGPPVEERKKVLWIQPSVDTKLTFDWGDRHGNLKEELRGVFKCYEANFFSLKVRTVVSPADFRRALDEYDDYSIDQLWIQGHGESFAIHLGPNFYLWSEDEAGRRWQGVGEEHESTKSLFKLVRQKLKPGKSGTLILRSCSAGATGAGLQANDREQALWDTNSSNSSSGGNFRKREAGADEDADDAGQRNVKKRKLLLSESSSSSSSSSIGNNDNENNTGNNNSNNNNSNGCPTVELMLRDDLIGLTKGLNQATVPDLFQMAKKFLPGNNVIANETTGYFRIYSLFSDKESDCLPEKHGRTTYVTHDELVTHIRHSPTGYDNKGVRVMTSRTIQRCRYYDGDVGGGGPTGLCLGRCTAISDPTSAWRSCNGLDKSGTPILGFGGGDGLGAPRRDLVPTVYTVATLGRCKLDDEDKYHVRTVCIVPPLGNALRSQAKRAISLWGALKHTDPLSAANIARVDEWLREKTTCPVTVLPGEGDNPAYGGIPIEERSPLGQEAWRPWHDDDEDGDEEDEDEDEDEDGGEDGEGDAENGIAIGRFMEKRGAAVLQA